MAAQQRGQIAANSRAGNRNVPPRLAGNASELQEVRLLFQLPGTEQKWLNTQ